METDDDFSFLEEQFSPYLIGDRTESSAMLAWFLEHVWREEPDEVEDALCDGSNDKGIDAIVIDEDAREIIVFQAKRRRSADRSQGDTDLKQFRGIAPYFRGPDGIDDLLSAAPNDDLRKLVERRR
jgi:Restriction endonuclease